MCVIKNTTPHWVHMLLPNGRSMHFPPAEYAARVRRNFRAIDPVEGIPCFDYVTDDVVEGLPDPMRDVWYIVSSLVFEASPGRYDLLVPDRIERDIHGRVTGCRSFKRRDS